MAQPEDIMSLLDRLQYGIDREDLPQSFVQKPPGQDPRALAIQRYMQMKGATPQRLPGPRDVGYGGKTKRMDKKGIGDMQGEMLFDRANDYDNDTADDFFKAPSSSMHRKPDQSNYVNSKGQLSPNENDPSLTSRVGTAPVKTAPRQEEMRQRDFWDEDGVKRDPDAPIQERNDLNPRSGRSYSDEEILQMMQSGKSFRDI